jgi:hypothetical protein
MAVMPDMQQLELDVQGYSAGSFIWVMRGRPVIAASPTAPHGAQGHGLDHSGRPSSHHYDTRWASSDWTRLSGQSPSPQTDVTYQVSVQ